MSEQALRDAHALVTGANRGIGAEVVRVLVREGAAVTLLVRDRGAAESLAATLPARARTHIVTADVTDGPALERACDEAAAALGPITILVNNAGSVETVPFLRGTAETFERMFAVHVMGAVTATRRVLPAMLERGAGRIVNVASIAGLQGAPYVAHYVAAKHALVGLTRALAVEFAGKGVTVNAVCPGYTDTDLVTRSLARISAKTGRSTDDAQAAILADAEQSRLVLPGEVAEAVLAFCLPSAGARTGEALVLMGDDPA
jgi:NAD(P)-dependent dehydrogenase (short-subunit alcohol dehydrogenase family)